MGDSEASPQQFMSSVRGHTKASHLSHHLFTSLHQTRTICVLHVSSLNLLCHSASPDSSKYLFLSHWWCYPGPPLPGVTLLPTAEGTVMWFSHTHTTVGQPGFSAWPAAYPPCPLTLTCLQNMCFWLPSLLYTSSCSLYIFHHDWGKKWWISLISLRKGQR